jgi:hypothetical protein
MHRGQRYYSLWKTADSAVDKLWTKLFTELQNYRQNVLSTEKRAGKLPTLFIHEKTFMPRWRL